MRLVLPVSGGFDGAGPSSILAVVGIRIPPSALSAVSSVFAARAGLADR